MRKLPLVAILVVALCAAPRAALSKTTGTISSAHWSYAVLAQLSECAELDGCLSNIGYFDFARTNFHLSRQEAAHLVLDILHRAEIYKSEPMTTDKTSRWFDRSPYFLRSREARDAMQALIDEYRDELAQIENKKSPQQATGIFNSGV